MDRTSSSLSLDVEQRQVEVGSQPAAHHPPPGAFQRATYPPVCAGFSLDMDAGDANRTLASVQLARDHAKEGRNGAATALLMQVCVAFVYLLSERIQWDFVYYFCIAEALHVEAIRTQGCIEGGNTEGVFSLIFVGAASLSG